MITSFFDPNNTTKCPTCGGDQYPKVVCPICGKPWTPSQMIQTSFPPCRHLIYYIMRGGYRPEGIEDFATHEVILRSYQEGLAWAYWGPRPVKRHGGKTRVPLEFAE